MLDEDLLGRAAKGRPDPHTFEILLDRFAENARERPIGLLRVATQTAEQACIQLGGEFHTISHASVFHDIS